MASILKQKYLILLRGINVGGKNPVSMTVLKKLMGEMGFSNVLTYIASGNVIVQSEKTAGEIKTTIETLLQENFLLDDGLIKALVLTSDEFTEVIERKPDGFGEQPEKYHSDAIFLMGIDSTEVMSAFKPREGVDRVWPGKGVIYSQRLSSQRTKSRLNQIMSTPFYKSMTIRNWNTTTKLLDLLIGLDAKSDS